MAGFTRSLLRLGSAFVATATIVIPALVLLAWGVLYIGRLFLLLTSPGVPIELSYEGQGGKMFVRADSYALDPLNLTAYVRNFVVFDETGVRYASMHHLYLRWQRPVVHATALGGYFNLQRIEADRFSFQSALPISDETRGEVPFVVNAKDIDVEYSDATRQPTLVESGHVERLVVEGAGDRFVAAGSVQIRRIGVLPVQVSRTESGLIVVNSHLRNTQLAAVLPHLERWLDPQSLNAYRPFAATQIVAFGPVQLTVPRGSTPFFAANLSGMLRGATVGNWLVGANLSLSAAVRGRSIRLIGRAQEARRSVEFDGVVAFGETVDVGGNLHASAANKAALWKPLRDLIPREAVYSGARYRGTARYVQGEYEFIGRLAARRFDWAGESFGSPDIAIAVDSKGLVATGLRTSWNGTPVAGNFQIDFKSGRMSGFARSSKADLRRLGEEFGLSWLRGVAAMEAVVSGTSRRPLVQLSSNGEAQMVRDGGPPTYLGLFAARGLLDRQGLRIRRFAISGPNGAAFAAGDYGLSSGKFDLDVTAGGIRLEAIDDRVSGLGFVQGSIEGMAKDFTYDGSLDMVGVRYGERELPLLSAVISGDEEAMAARDVVALIGAARAQGGASFEFKTNAIAGSFDAQGVSLSEWLGPDVVGIATAHSILLSGTIDDPQITGTIEAKEFVALGVSVDNAVATVFGDGERLVVQTGTAKVGKGTIDVSGEYQFGSELGTIAMQVKDLPLTRVEVPERDLNVEGTITGNATASFNAAGLTKGDVQAKFQDLGVNGQQIGDGPASVQIAGRQWNANAMVGEVDPPSYVRLNNAMFDQDTEQIAAQLDVFGIALQDIIRAFGAEVASLEGQPRFLVQTAKGQIAGTSRISGTLDQPQVEFESLMVDQLVVADRDAGKLEAKGSWSKGLWEATELKWIEGSSSLNASGRIEEEGQLAVEGELANFDLSWLDLIVPSLSAYAGKADLSFRLSGATANPEGIASLGLKDLGYTSDDGTLRTLPLNASLDTIELQNKSIKALGAFSYEDFSGVIQASGPLSALSSDPDRSAPPLIARVDLKERSLDEFTGVLTWMDPQRTEGKLTGHIQYTGFLDDYKLDGRLSLAGTSIGSKDFDTYAQDFSIVADLNDGNLSATGGGKSSAGGSFAMNAVAALPNSLDGIESLQDFMQRTSVGGGISANDLSFRYKESDRSKRIVGSVAGALQFKGNLLEPVIAGIPGQPMMLSNIDVSIPSEFEARAEKSEYPINPRFEAIHVVSSQSGIVRTSTANLSLNLDATLAGSLQYPNLLATLTVVSGVFSLPTSRISLEPGGKLNFSYVGTPASEPQATLGVRLEGTTYVSALRFQDSVERYRIELDITGNLLEENGLILKATSDPPGLSQDQILGLIGQTALLESLTKNAFSQRFGAGISEAIYGFAIPSLLNPLTESIASSLRLDYLNVEYNPFDKISVVAAKSLGSGVTIFGKRQLLNSVTGRQKYELKLTYRIPVRKGELSRIAVGIGFDQDRPWKITLDYGRKF